MNFAKYRVQLSTEKKYSSKYEYKYEYEYSIPVFMRAQKAQSHAGEVRGHAPPDFL